MGIYRIQARLDADDPQQEKLIKKIKERDKILHKTVSDYIIHAVYEFEEKNEKEKVLRRIIREEMQNNTGKDQESKDAATAQKKEEPPTGIDLDIFKLLGKN